MSPAAALIQPYTDEFRAEVAPELVPMLTGKVVTADLDVPSRDRRSATHGIKPLVGGRALSGQERPTVAASARPPKDFARAFGTVAPLFVEVTTVTNGSQPNKKA